MTRHIVCKESELPLGELKAFKAGDTNILVYHLEDGCRIRCPLHRAEFDIRTGEVHKWANFPPGIQMLNVVRGEKALKTYSAVVEDGNVVVEL